jgi:hypothetical protein
MLAGIKCPTQVLPNKEMDSCKAPGFEPGQSWWLTKHATITPCFNRANPLDWITP